MKGQLEDFQLPVEVPDAPLCVTIIEPFQSCADSRKLAAGFGWDGNSAAQGSCALGEDGADCRRQLLLLVPLLHGSYTTIACAIAC